MRILFIADPVSGFKIKKDSTYVMMQSAHQFGHAIFVCEAKDLSVDLGRVMVKATALTLTNQTETWYRLGPTQSEQLRQFDAVLMRKDPPFDLEYLYASQLLTQAEKQGAKVFTSGQALRDFNEKLAILNFPDLISPTLVSSSPEQIKAFVLLHQDAILKPLDGMGGDGIFRVTPQDPNLNVIIETVSQKGHRTIMAQRYIPEIKLGDKRILMINGQAVDWCLARIPQGGETRGNLAAGGKGVAQPLSDRDREIASVVGPELVKRGILLAGLDVIGSYLTEVNVTSPTGFREIATQSGIDTGALFIKALESVCEKNL